MIMLIEILLLIGTVVFIGYPLFGKKYENVATEGGVVNDYQRLLSKKDMVYSAIKDLEFDYKTGKLSQEDYEELTSQYESEAVEILKHIDSFFKKGKKKTRAAPEGKKSFYCPQCRNMYTKNEKFCSNCGTKL